MGHFQDNTDASILYNLKYDGYIQFPFRFKHVYQGCRINCLTVQREKIVMIKTFTNISLCLVNF